MATTQLFIGQTPPTAAGRRALRDQAFDIYAQLRQANRPAPTVALLNFEARPEGDAGVGAYGLPDLLLIRPHALIVALVSRHPGPIDAPPGEPWRDRASGALITGPAGLGPLELARAHRDAVVDRLRGADVGLLLPQSARVIAAVVCAPAIHPESQISLDVDDHRRGLKVLGLDELSGVAAMAQSGVELTDDQMRVIVVDVFGGRLWFDGGRALFELAAPRFGLRLLQGDRAGELVLLPEGETVIGRRRTPRRYERRFAIVGDDLVSSDHAVLEYGDDDALTLRDISKNGTWVAGPGEPERHVRGAELRLAPGAVLRLGMSRLRVERVER